MPKPLHRLPDGAHFVLSDIVAVVPSTKAQPHWLVRWFGQKTATVPEIHIHFHQHIFIRANGFTTAAAAQSFADDLAARVNKAREG